MKVKAKKSFKNLGIENSYQGLPTPKFEALVRGEEVEIDALNPFIENHVQIVGKKPIKERKDGDK
jgi:hypothetical protein